MSATPRDYVADREARIRKAGGKEAFNAYHRRLRAEREKSKRERAAETLPMGVNPTRIMAADGMAIQEAVTLEEYRRLELNRPLTWMPGRRGGGLQRMMTTISDRVGDQAPTMSARGLTIREVLQ